MQNKTSKNKTSKNKTSKNKSGKKSAPQAKPALTSLQGFQRRFLRAAAHPLKAVVQVGQNGITEAVIGAIDSALLAHELIKVRIYEPEDKKAMAEELARRSGAHLCGLIGHHVMLYRPHPDKPRLVVPRRNVTPSA